MASDEAVGWRHLRGRINGDGMRQFIRREGLSGLDLIAEDLLVGFGLIPAGAGTLGDPLAQLGFRGFKHQKLIRNIQCCQRKIRIDRAACA